MCAHCDVLRPSDQERSACWPFTVPRWRQARSLHHPERSISRWGYANLRCGRFLVETYVKVKELGPVGGGAEGAGCDPLDPPMGSHNFWIRLTQHQSLCFVNLSKIFSWSTCKVLFRISISSSEERQFLIVAQFSSCLSMPSLAFSSTL